MLCSRSSRWFHTSPDAAWNRAEWKTPADTTAQADEVSRLPRGTLRPSHRPQRHHREPEALRWTLRPSGKPCSERHGSCRWS